MLCKMALGGTKLWSPVSKGRRFECYFVACGGDELERLVCWTLWGDEGGCEGDGLAESGGAFTSVERSS